MNKSVLGITITDSRINEFQSRQCINYPIRIIQNQLLLQSVALYFMCIKYQIGFSCALLNILSITNGGGGGELYSKIYKHLL